MRLETLLLGLSLVGCAAQPPAGGVVAALPSAPGPAIGLAPGLALRAPAECRLDRVAVLALEAGDKPVVTIGIDGRALRMAVDTGAETSVLSPQAVASLGLSPVRGETDVQGLAGTAEYGSVRIDRIDFGDGPVRGRVLPVMRLGAEAEPPAGLIGADLLRPYQVVFDFPARRLSLYRAKGCAQVGPGGDGQWSGLRWRVAAHELPLVRASLDGRGLIALLDTGTAHSAVATARAGIDRAGLGRDPAVTGYAAGGLALHGSLHRFGELDLGAIGVDRPVLRVVRLDGLPIDMLIGMDVLRTRRLWLDYPGRQAFVEDVAPGS